MIVWPHVLGKEIVPRLAKMALTCGRGTVPSRLDAVLFIRSLPDLAPAPETPRLHRHIGTPRAKGLRRQALAACPWACPSVPIANIEAALVEVTLSIQRISDSEVVRAFVQHLAAQGRPGLKVDRVPEDEHGEDPPIDAIAGPFAIEHTSVDTVENQRRDASWFMRGAGELEGELRGRLPYRLSVVLPYEGIENLRPESKAAVQEFLFMMKSPEKQPLAMKDRPQMPITFLRSAVCLLGALSLDSTSFGEPPKLVLQITVDQLRGDTLTRFGDRFCEGGFRYLLTLVFFTAD